MSSIRMHGIVEWSETLELPFYSFNRYEERDAISNHTIDAMKFPNYYYEPEVANSFTSHILLCSYNLPFWYKTIIGTLMERAPWFDTLILLKERFSNIWDVVRFYWFEPIVNYNSNCVRMTDPDIQYFLTRHAVYYRISYIETYVAHFQVSKLANCQKQI